jgi:hypothetical protein
LPDYRHLPDIPNLNNYRQAIKNPGIAGLFKIVNVEMPGI